MKERHTHTHKTTHPHPHVENDVVKKKKKKRDQFRFESHRVSTTACSVQHAKTTRLPLRQQKPWGCEQAKQARQGFTASDSISLTPWLPGNGGGCPHDYDDGSRQVPRGTGGNPGGVGPASRRGKLRAGEHRAAHLLN